MGEKRPKQPIGCGARAPLIAAIDNWHEMAVVGHRNPPKIRGGLMLLQCTAREEKNRGGPPEFSRRANVAILD